MGLSIATLAQEGASSPRFAETRICPLFDIPISVKEIREECKKYNTTFRRLGRALSKMAIMSAKKFDIEGNLAKSYKLTYPNASREELYYQP